MRPQAPRQARDLLFYLNKKLVQLTFCWCLILFNRAPTRIRTWDLLLKREQLYQLSYRGLRVKIIRKYCFCCKFIGLVPPEGIEPPSLGSKPSTLSFKLWGLIPLNYCGNTAILAIFGSTATCHSLDLR